MATRSLKELMARRRGESYRPPSPPAAPPVSGTKSNVSLAFARSLTTWNQRRRRMSDGAVGKQGEDVIAQGERIEKELRAALRNQHYEHALDFGCGWGRFSSLLIEHCQHLWSVDMFDDWVDRAAAYPTVTGITLKSSQLPFDSQSMNLIVDVMTFQSIDQDILKEHYATELLRVAAPGAKIISLTKATDKWAMQRLPLALRLASNGGHSYCRSAARIDEAADDEYGGYNLLVGEIGSM